MLKIPTNKYEMLIEESNILYENIKNNIDIIEYNNSKVILNNKLKKDILNQLNILINKLILYKNIQINLLNLENNYKYYILNLINNYENLSKITNPNILINNIFCQLYFKLNKNIKNFYLNDLDQFYKFNDLDYFINNKLCYNIEIIINIIDVISLLNIITVDKTIVYNSDIFVNFRNNLNCFLNCFNNNIINEYKFIEYFDNNNIIFEREINFYKILFYTKNN